MNERWRKKSIVSFFSFLTIILVLGQIIIMSSLLIFGGMFKQAKSGAYKAFDDTVNNRKEYLQQEMNHRWTNLDPYLPDLSVVVSKQTDSVEETFDLATDTLIRMLRLTGITGVYIILDEPQLNYKQHPALYLRDYDPLINSSKNDDIHVVYGPPTLASKHQFPLDATWQYHFVLTKENQNFYTKPLEHATEVTDTRYLGYWNEPFQLTDGDIPIITYSMPLQDVNNQVVGVIGIELSVSYLAQSMPMGELQPKDSLGYIIAKRNGPEKPLQTMIQTNKIQKRFLPAEKSLIFDRVDDNFSVSTLRNHQTKDKIYASASQFNLYPHNSPFQQEEWHIIGFVKDDYLLSYVHRIEWILLFAIVILLISGVLTAIFISRKMSKPVVHLADQIVQADKMESLTLQSTGLAELDDLAKAVVQTNKLMLDSALRLSRIIEMVALPIGAFEINTQTGRVVVAGRFYEILDVDVKKREQIEKREHFDALLDWALSIPEPEEQNVFILPSNDRRWIRIKRSTTENYIYGIVEDVTEETLLLKQVKHDRDFDPLTGLLNRKSFQRHFSIWHDTKPTNTAALIMFDLDFLKVINDTYGHKWGDYYIVQTAERLRKIASEQNLILSRLSGDEFTVLLHGFADKEAIRERVTQFYKKLASYPLQFPGGELRPIRISAGLVWLEQDQLNLQYEQLLHQADEALYYSKHHQKGSYTEYHDRLVLFED